MRNLLALFLIVIVAPIHLAYAQAKITQKRAVATCVAQAEGKPYKYNNIDPRGHIGPYAMDVNTLFDAGVCEGALPSGRTTNWDLCNFGGLPATDNGVTKLSAFIGNVRIQDLYLNAVLAHVQARYLDAPDSLGKIAVFDKYANGRELVAGAIYRKGVKALTLFTQMGIEPTDERGHTLSQFLKVLENCGGYGETTPGVVQQGIRNAADSFIVVNKTQAQNFNLRSPDAATQTKIRSLLKTGYKGVDKLPETDSFDYDDVDINGNGIKDYIINVDDPSFAGRGNELYIIFWDEGKSAKEYLVNSIQYSKHGLIINGYASVQ